MLQIILGQENLRLLTPAQTEKEFRTMPWLRSIRVDVYALDQSKENPCMCQPHQIQRGGRCKVYAELGRKDH